MSYSSNNFLKPIGSDKNIKFYDNTGSLTYTVKPTFITDVIDEVNLLRVILKSSKEIVDKYAEFLAKEELEEDVFGSHEYILLIDGKDSSYSWDEEADENNESWNNIEAAAKEKAIIWTLNKTE